MAPRISVQSVRQSGLSIRSRCQSAYFSCTAYARAKAPNQGGAGGLLDLLHSSSTSTPSKKAGSPVPDFLPNARRPPPNNTKRSRNETTKNLTDTLNQNIRPQGKLTAPERRAVSLANSAADRQASESARALESHYTRNWREGDVYAPHDLSPAEMQKTRYVRQRSRVAQLAYKGNTRRMGHKDVIDDLAIVPVREYKNFSMMSEFVTEMGRIRHGRETGLRGVNQRRMARAVRRAIGLGIMPSVHRHPELMPERVRERDPYPSNPSRRGSGTAGVGLFGR